MDVIDAVLKCDKILEDLEELPERAEEFSASVEEKVLNIKGWIQEHDQVTETQENALNNMGAGVERWLGN